MKQRTLHRFLATVLTLLLVIEMLPANVFAIGTEDTLSDSSPLYADVESSPSVVREVEDLRTEDGKQFQMSDGSFMAVSYGMPVHFQSEDGSWMDIDNALQLTDGDAADTMYEAANGSARISFAPDLTKDTVFTTTYADQSISFSLLNQDNYSSVAEDESQPGLESSSSAEDTGNSQSTPSEGTTENATEAEPASQEMEPDAPESSGPKKEPETAEEAAILPVEPSTYHSAVEAQLVQGEQTSTYTGETGDMQKLDDTLIPEKLTSSVLYENVFQGVDLQYNATGYNIKESIIVKEPLDSYRFSFKMNLSGLTPQLDEDGSVVLLDANGSVSYYIPAPYVFDSEYTTSNAASYILSDSVSGGFILTVTADANWMNASERVYPITIDPTLIKVAGNAEGEINATYVVEGDPNGVHGHYQDLYFGYSSYLNQKEHQIYMHFSKLPELPMGAVVVDATLNLWQFNYSQIACPEMDIGAYEVTEDTSGNYSSYHNWIYYMTWNNKPAYDKSNMIDYTTATAARDDRYLTWELTKLVNKWYESGTKNRTIALVATDADSYNNSYCAAPAFNAYGGSHPPILTVSYRNNTGIEPYYTYQTMGVGNAGTAYIADFSNQLTVAKELFTFASTTNPFSVQLVYNSAYFSKRTDTQYDLGSDLGMEMHFGSGWTYNFIQHLKKETIDGTEYIRYLDGDGTIHYFSKDSEKDAEIKKETGASKLVTYYYDEDGLGLKINEYASGYFSMTDDQGNEWVFVNGPLLWVKDHDGNMIRIYYTKNGTATTSSYPTGSKDRIEKITQKNVGGTEVTIATFRYKSHTPSNSAVANYVDTITDYAGNTYSFDYKHGKLISIRYNGGEIVQYGMRSSNGWLQNELTRMTDVEAGYSLNFSYSNHRVSSAEESSSSGTGVKIEISRTNDRNTVYRDSGKDRIIGNSDDILTYYGFDYAGRTVNAYTTNAAGDILGASNVAYSGNGSTERTNNRTLRTASIGIAAQQELRNFGFESSASDVAWTMHKTSSDATADVNAVVNGDKARTGAKSLKTWVSTGKTGLVSASKASNLLQANTTYTLSAYINTSQAQSFSGKGIYLQVKDASGNTWKSSYTNYKTSALVDDGWVQISLTFKTKVKGNHTVALYNDSVGGAVFADDFQLQLVNATVSQDTEAISNVNLLENGSLQHWGYGWTMNAGASYASGIGVHSTSSAAYSIKVNGSPRANNYASQTVTVNQPGTQTYVLSGWAKANSVPDNKMDGDPKKDNEAAAKDKNKQFGLRAVLTYANNGGTEYYYAPFNPDLPGWQFTSLTIVPKQSGKTVASIRVECAYEKNANTAWFDDLSLVKEAAQSMRYDEKGNLISVTTTGLKADADTYKNGNLIKSVTGGNGTYTYTYDSTYKHRLTAVSNGMVTQSMGYDASGNVTSTTLKSDTGSFAKTLKSSAAYTSNNNLVASVTDTANQKESYVYGTKQSVMTGQATAVSDAKGNTTTTTYDSKGRVTKKDFANKGSLVYTYTEGILSGVTRKNAAGTTQEYLFNHDSFGNLTGVSVGGIPLTSYEYGAKNGSLLTQRYGNGATVSFTYDNLGRVQTSTYSDGRILHYSYTGDGQLYSVTDNNGTTDSADDTTYSYTYDTLGRAIRCQVTQGIQVLLQIHWEYDSYNRISSQSWQVGSQSYKERYSYSEKDGSLTGITTDGGGKALQFTYDPLQRLSSVSNGVYTRSYSYRDISGTQTTTQLEKLAYTGLTGSLSGLSYQYAYNPLGSIASITPSVGNAESYVYDNLGQLTSAKIGSTSYAYTYDGSGNLLTASNGTQTNTYTYGNSGWQDLLTGFNGEAIAYEGQSFSDGSISGTPVSGNPISYYNGVRWNLGWSEGRNLSTASSSTEDADTSLSYSYDANGLRTKKTVVTKTYDTVRNHDYEVSVIAPTCTEEGYTLHECECGDTYRTEVIAALGHNYEESGLDTYTCTRCGDTYSDHTHRYTETVVDPTCTTDGYTLHECPCGHSYRDNIVNKLKHDYKLIGERAGIAYFRCTRCGDTYNSPVIEITDPKPPVSEYSLRDGAAPVSSGCTTQRILKETVTETHSYIYAGGKLLRETIETNGTSKTLDFRYDNAGAPYALIYNDGSNTSVYYYVTNLQGDVTYLVDANGAEAAAYTYDPYGKVLSSSGTMAAVNPLQYRGYYHDSETGFYYLQSRYYDPEICRFINADSYASTGQSYLGYNTFAYCGNDPVNRTDADGEFWDTVFDIVSLGFSIADVIQNPSDPWAWAGLVGDVIDLIPFVTGVGELTKAAGAVADAANVIDDVYDTAKAVDNVVDAGQSAKKGWKVGDDISNLTSAGKTPSWDTVRSRYWKNQAANPSGSSLYKRTEDNIIRMEKGRAPLDINNKPINLHHVQGKANNMYDFIEMTQSAHQAFHKAYGYKNFPNILKMGIM